MIHPPGGTSKDEGIGRVQLVVTGRGLVEEGLPQSSLSRSIRQVATAVAAPGTPPWEVTRAAELREECAAQATLLRDIFGPLPFHPLPPLSPSLLAWDDGLVHRLAKLAYEERSLPAGHLDPARLAVLCDALLDAGCPADSELLLHLRAEGPHWRGCHALDAILGREQATFGRDG